MRKEENRVLPQKILIVRHIFYSMLYSLLGRRIEKGHTNIAKKEEALVNNGSTPSHTACMDLSQMVVSYRRGLRVCGRFLAVAA